MTKKAQPQKELNTILESLKLDEEIFTDEVMGKIALVVESQSNERLQEKEAALEEKNKKEIAAFKEQLIDQLDSYLNYFVENFIKENKQQIADSVKVKTAERVLENFNNMVSDFNLSLSEEVVDQTDEINDLKEKLNKAVNENISLKEDINESNKYALILEQVQEIKIDSEKSTFAKIAENFDYKDDDSFKAKLTTLRESIVTEKDEEVDEEMDDKEMEEAQDEDSEEEVKQESYTGTMKSYLKVLNG